MKINIDIVTTRKKLGTGMLFTDQQVPVTESLFVDGQAALVAIARARAFLDSIDGEPEELLKLRSQAETSALDRDAYDGALLKLRVAKRLVDDLASELRAVKRLPRGIARRIQELKA